MGISNLQGIAHGLLGTFESRNNEISGYWGLGVLRKLAESNGVDKLEIDLLSEHYEDEAMESCRSRYRCWLETNLERNNLSLSALLFARIRLRFANEFTAYPNAIRNTRGFPYECLIELRRGDGRDYVAGKIGVFGP